MTILRKPGSTIRVHLPSEAWKDEKDRMVIHLKIPDQGLFVEIEEICNDNLTNFETGRRVVGLVVERIDNLFVTGASGDPEPFKLDREKSRHLTVECAEWLGSYLGDIVGLILDLPRITEVEQKNC